MSTHKRKTPPDANMLLRIEVAMRRKNMSQRELAEAVGKTESAVSHWFNGRHEPDRPSLRRLAELLGVSIDWLMGKPLDTDVDLDLERYILDFVKEGGPSLLEALRRLSTGEAIQALKDKADNSAS